MNSKLTEQDWFVIAENWIGRTNRLYQASKNKDYTDKQRFKAKKLWDMMQSRVIMIFAHIIRGRMAQAQAKNKIIIPGKQMANDQSSKLFNRHFKKR